VADSHQYSSPEVEYVESDDKISLRKLAKKWGVKFGTIAARSRRRQWAKMRDEYHGLLVTSVQQKNIEGEAGHVSEIYNSVRQSLSLAAWYLEIGLRDRDFNLLKVAKISTETIQNVHGLLKEHYGQSGGTGITAEQFAIAVDTLAVSPETETPIPRPI